ncbi:MAG: M20/M25/M40 family metallo-hydrolase [Sphaerochaetaceae bacterium]
MEKREKTYALKLQKMIQCETVSIKDVVQKEKFDRFHEVLKDLFPHVFATCEIHDFDGSLLFKWKSSNPQGEPILLMSHQDVVAANAKDWKHPPFSGDIDENGAIWGRGTVDTKGSLFCIFQAVDELIAENYQNKVDVYIASSCGEEILGPGARSTSEYLQKQNIHLQLLLDEGGMITYEPLSGAKARFAMMGCLEKGTGNFKFLAHGKGGHASTPGKNTPLPRLGAFMNDIERKNPFTAKMNPITLEMFRRMGPTMHGILGFIFRHAKGFSPLLEKLLPKANPAGAAMISTTIAFTTAQGSDGLNVLPQEAFVTGNIRFIHHEGVEKTKHILGEIAARHDIEIEIINATEPCPMVDITTTQYKMVEDTIKELFPKVIPCPYAMTGGTDARFYTPVCPNAIRFAPLEINKQQYLSIHGVDENIDVKVLPAGVDFYRTIVKKIG